jgi:predicted DNA repair protein MutK
VASQRVMIKLITATLQTGTLSQPSSHQGECPQALVILLPVALLLHAFLPWMLTPLLMIGGAYLCFEGAEKVWHLIVHHKDHGPQQAKKLDAAHLEEQRVKGAIKTDFILSAEIMTISLSQIDIDTLWIQAVALAAVAIAITALVYGVVALLVKADDFGVLLSAKGRLAPTRVAGRGIVKSMPSVMLVIASVGTVAMLWVGGSTSCTGCMILAGTCPKNRSNRPQSPYRITQAQRRALLRGR